MSRTLGWQQHEVLCELVKHGGTWSARESDWHYGSSPAAMLRILRALTRRDLVIATFDRGVRDAEYQITVTGRIIAKRSA